MTTTDRPIDKSDILNFVALIEAATKPLTVEQAEEAEDKALAAAIEARDLADQRFYDEGPLRQRADRLWKVYLDAQRATIEAMDAADFDE